MPLLVALLLVGLVAAAFLAASIALWAMKEPDEYVFDDIAEYR